MARAAIIVNIKVKLKIYNQRERERQRLTVHAARGETSAGESPIELGCGTVDRCRLALVVSATREAVLGAKAWEQRGSGVGLRRHQTEEGVMLHTGLP